MEWQPIETAPRDGTPILGVSFREYIGGGTYPDGAVMMWEPGGWAYMGFAVIYLPSQHHPTHWMPLPPLPEAPNATP